MQFGTDIDLFAVIGLIAGNFFFRTGVATLLRRVLHRQSIFLCGAQLKKCPCFALHRPYLCDVYAVANQVKETDVTRGLAQLSVKIGLLIGVVNPRSIDNW